MKSVAILLQGNSLSLLEDNIKQFKDKDWLWASLNRFGYVEKNILSKINKKLDIVYCSSKQRFTEEQSNISHYLRTGQGLFITNSETRIENPLVQDKLFLCDFGYGFNSLMAMIFALIKMGCKEIYLFGADGGSIQNDKVYYKQENIDENYEARKISIEKDTEMINDIFWKLIEYWNFPKIKIINVNPLSKINCFEKKDIGDIINES